MIKQTKKNIEFMKKMAMEIYGKQFLYNDIYYIANRYSAIRFEDEVDGIEVDNSQEGKKFAKLFEPFIEKNNYKRYELPNMANGIKECVGRKMSTVVYSHKKELPNINARYARDIMSLIGTTSAFMLGKRDPIFFLDIHQTDISIGLLLPTCVNINKEKEFWRYEDV